jgi:hypothetical protein
MIESTKLDCSPDILNEEEEWHMLVAILHWIIILGTLATGIISLFKPRSILSFIGFEGIGGRGITEVRAIFGGLFIGLAVAPVLLNDPAAYKMLGIGYLAIGIARLPAMILDRSAISSNWISLVIEFVFGLILLLT